MKEKLIKIILLCIGIVLIIFGISKPIKHEIIEVQGNIYQAKASAGGTLAVGEKNPSTYRYNIHPGDFEIYDFR